MSGYTDITLLQYELAKLHTRVADLEERRCEVCGYAEHHREQSPEKKFADDAIAIVKGQK